MRAVFLASVRDLVRETDFRALEAALARRDTDDALGAIPWQRLERTLLDIRDPLRGVVEEATRVAGKQVARQVASGELILTQIPGLDLSASIEVLNPFALDWVETRGAQLVVDITAQTRFAIQDLVARAYLDGVHPRQLARELRSAIGVTRRQGAILGQMRHDLLEQGLSQDRVRRQVARRARMFLGQRAQGIARTETVNAMNAGQRSLWQDLAQRGALDPAKMEREWLAVVPSDGRTCKICEGLDAQRAPIEGSYPAGLVGPTAHVACRCTERLVPVQQAA